jgi:hypothetical protein
MLVGDVLLAFFLVFAVLSFVWILLLEYANGSATQNISILCQK